MRRRGAADHASAWQSSEAGFQLTRLTQSNRGTCFQGTRLACPRAVRRFQSLCLQLPHETSETPGGLLFLAPLTQVFHDVFDDLKLRINFAHVDVSENVHAPQVEPLFLALVPEHEASLRAQKLVDGGISIAPGMRWRSSSIDLA